MHRTVINMQTGEKTIVPFTEEEMAEYLIQKAESDALELVKAQAQAAYDAAAAVFMSLPIGKQALWEPVRGMVAKSILEGNMATAKEILETVPALYEGAEEDRALFLALFA
jgi:hypothetical protein